MGSIIKIIFFLFLFFIISFSYAEGVTGIFGLDEQHNLWRCTSRACLEVEEGDFEEYSMTHRNNVGVFVVDRTVPINLGRGAGYLFYCTENGCNQVDDSLLFVNYFKGQLFGKDNSQNIYAINYPEQKMYYCNTTGCNLIQEFPTPNDGGFIPSFLKNPNTNEVLVIDDGYDVWRCDPSICYNIFDGDVTNGSYSWNLFRSPWPRNFLVAEIISVPPEPNLRTSVRNCSLDAQSCQSLLGPTTGPMYQARLLGNNFYAYSENAGPDTVYCRGNGMTTKVIDYSEGHNFGGWATTSESQGIFITEYPLGKVWYCDNGFYCGGATCTELEGYDSVNPILTPDGSGGVYGLSEVIPNSGVWHCTTSECTQISIEQLRFPIGDGQGGIFLMDYDSGVKGNLWHCTQSSCSKIANGKFSGGLSDGEGGIFTLGENNEPWHCTLNGCNVLSSTPLINSSLELIYQTQINLPQRNSIIDFSGDSNGTSITLAISCLVDTGETTIEIIQNEEVIQTELEKDCSVTGNEISIVLDNEINNLFEVKATISEPCETCSRTILIQPKSLNSITIPDNNLFLVILSLLVIVSVLYKKKF